MRNIIVAFLAVLITLLLAPSCNNNEKKENSKEEWVPLFDGTDLTGWDIKVAGQPLNDNYKNTFRVQDSILRISYDQYDKFDNKFGHIYYQSPFSYYKIKFHYRFVGAHLKDAPVWADMNSGIMIHSQSAQSVNIGQDFPVSLEMQLLADTGTHDRTTGNICTPGTQIHLFDSLRTDHCISSTSKTYPSEIWVNGEAEVYGDSLIRHIIEGDTVLTYTKPVIGGGFVSNTNNWTTAHITDSIFWINKAGTPLREGYIALQAESQPVDFRRIEILNLVGCTDPKAKNYKSYYIKSDNNQCRY